MTETEQQVPFEPWTAMQEFAAYANQTTLPRQIVLANTYPNKDGTPRKGFAEGIFLLFPFHVDDCTSQLNYRKLHAEYDHGGLVPDTHDGFYLTGKKQLGERQYAIAMISLAFVNPETASVPDVVIVRQAQGTTDRSHSVVWPERHRPVMELLSSFSLVGFAQDLTMAFAQRNGIARVEYNLRQKMPYHQEVNPAVNPFQVRRKT